jgi:arylsulfatase A-like enzyme
MIVRKLVCGVAALSLAWLVALGACVSAAEKPNAKKSDTAKATITFADPAWVKAASRPTPASKPSSRPVEAIDHVVIISIDGCRPDILLRNNTPNIHALLPQSAFTFWARTTPNSITLPSHVSMLTGVNPRKHGIEWNRDLPLYQPVYPNFPTVFYYAKRYGYTTGMAAGKSKFEALTVAGTLDHESVPKKATGADTDVTEAASEIIKDHKPNLMFVHLPGNDNAGHKYGWGSKEQDKAIENADQAVGQVLKAVKEAGLAEHTVFIITADHGGSGKTHGPDDYRSRHIPWICYGPGVRKALDLTTDGDLEVRTEDTFATACWLLGIPLDLKRIDGRPVKAAFFKPSADEELLQPAR